MFTTELSLVLAAIDGRRAGKDRNLSEQGYVL
jgi:hypothetical protein